MPEDVSNIIAHRIEDILKENMNDLVDVNEIRVEDYELSNETSSGISIVIAEEQDAGGLNDVDDTRYRTRLVRISSNVHNQDQIIPRSIWRRRVKRLFHNKLLGIEIPGACEIITKVRYSRFLDPKKLRAKIELSHMVIETLVRETRD